MEDSGEAMIKQCKVLAYKGDPTALRLCIERLLQPCRPSNHRFHLPAVKTLRDLEKALPVVLKQVAKGQLSAREGESISRTLESQRRTVESVDLKSGALEKVRKRESGQGRKKA
jgi:hypothetical protein